MQIITLHDWNISTKEAVDIQNNLALKVISDVDIKSARLIAGTDVSVRNDNRANAAVVIIKLPEYKILETVCTSGTVDFPYIPGLLSFREIPILIKAFTKVKNTPDIIMVDGQGTAHPRRFGLACHLGILTDIPTIGCAKTHLYGEYSTPGDTRGNYSLISDRNKNVIGAVLRTKDNIKPIFVSIGHKINLNSCIDLTLRCCNKYRLPEPVRLAHLASKGKL